MRNDVKSGDFAKLVERSHSGEPVSEATNSISLPQTSATLWQRIVVALLSLVGAGTFAGVGLHAIATGIASGRTRSGSEFVLTGGYASWSGLLAIVAAVSMIGFFVKQLPARARTVAFLLLVVALMLAVALAFGGRTD